MVLVAGEQTFACRALSVLHRAFRTRRQLSDSRIEDICDCDHDGCFRPGPSGNSSLSLSLFDTPIGALITGQVFDRYPDSLQLHNLAKRLNLSPENVWRSARLELPISGQTLCVYGRLVETFGNTFLQARYQSVTDAERLDGITQLNKLSYELELRQRELAAQRARR